MYDSHKLRCVYFSIKYVFLIWLQVPAFESGDGKYLTESNAIAYYLANEQLRGKSDYEKAQIMQWVNFGDSEILPASCAWVFPILGILQFNKVVNIFLNKFLSKIEGIYVLDWLNRSRILRVKP